MTNVNGNWKPKGKNLVKYSKITAAKGRIKGGYECGVQKDYSRLYNNI